ncbi:glycosyl hydrolase [Sphingopyxis sp. CCNWLW253]|uniref:glycosyl hydrolase n=1 Tax=unclassified Sphingopyxis TaxID=2614943 RepID=UPI003012A618
MIRETAIALMASLALAAPPAVAQSADPMREDFASPPHEARPWVWWHWLDGNVTREGINRDLEWFERIGIGGFQLFDVAQPGVPKVVDHRLIYMRPDWQGAFRHAIAEGRRRGMEAGIASSPGWSETGGPWVTPEAAMKKLVWSETLVEGGRRFAGRLAPPPAVAGPFQDIARDQAAKATASFYRDVAVLAWRVPADAGPLPAAKISASGGTLDAALLTGSALDRAPGAVLPLAQASPQWVRFDYDRPQTIRSVVVGLTRPGLFDVAPIATLEASEDGAAFRAVRDLPLSTFHQNTVSFPAVTARAFRVTFRPPTRIGTIWRRILNLRAPGIANNRYDQPPPVQDIRLQRLALLPDARVTRFEDKAGFATAPDYYALATPEADAGSIVPAAGVIDLTARLTPDGSLDWTPPRGRWQVLRLGASLTGAVNAPAPTEATGYEVDKLDAGAVAAYMDRYLDTYRATLPPELLGARGVTTILNDSIEAGSQNWTRAMIDAFRARRGYDPTPWLPALTGRIVDSAEASDRFLWDYRTTIAELLAANHYGQVAMSARSAGLRVRAEALEDHRPILGDDMAMRAHADEPAGAIWAPNQKSGIDPTSIADLQGAASVAHLYGRDAVAAEAFTSALAPWAGSPRSLKRVADTAFALGVTRLMLHSSVHQPVEGKPPGLTLGIFGQYFNRNETWAGQARAWIDYLARSQYLLRQGQYVADIAYFHGEEAPLTGLYGEHEVGDIPAGHGFDFVNAGALVNLLRVEDGRLVTPSGMEYRLLQLGGTSSEMTLPTLRHIAALVDAGATVVGKRPVGSPSLADDRADYDRLVASLWCEGRVLDIAAAEALKRLGVGPDWQVTGEPLPLRVLHRTMKDRDIYFLASGSRSAARTEIAFRVIGRAPELWDADSGAVTPLPYRVEDGRTIVPLVFDPDGSAFVIFREGAGAAPKSATREELLLDLSKGWTLSFQPERGGPDASVLADAASWSESSDPRIRYFSGTGSYSRDVTLDRHQLAGKRLLLDLGEVGEIVDVVVNGRTLRTLWKPPYRLDISAALVPGANRIELRVTNLWVNRLIGDARPGVDKRTATAIATYRPDAPLLPSGLIGPVRLIALRQDLRYSDG